MIQLSTGDMLREARTSGTEMGRKVAEVMDRGDLVTDEIVIGLIEEQLEGDAGGGFIFDGFPRTLPQADALGALLARRGETLDAVIEMRVERRGAGHRISGRSTCASCGEVYNDLTRSPSRPTASAKVCGGTEFKRRADDNAESLKQRLMEYYKKTSPLIGYYYAKGSSVASTAWARSTTSRPKSDSRLRAHRFPNPPLTRRALAHNYPHLAGRIARSPGSSSLAQLRH
jgi:adenylate kinase